jgi:hypothetical protein
MHRVTEQEFRTLVQAISEQVILFCKRDRLKRRQTTALSFPSEPVYNCCTFANLCKPVYHQCTTANLWTTGSHCITQLITNVQLLQISGLSMYSCCKPVDYQCTAVANQWITTVQPLQTNGPPAVANWWITIVQLLQSSGSPVYSCCKPVYSCCKLVNHQCTAVTCRKPVYQQWITLHFSFAFQTYQNQPNSTIIIDNT